MSLAKKGIVPPEEWHHSPELKSSNGITVSMYLIKNKIIPPEEWI